MNKNNKEEKNTNIDEKSVNTSSFNRRSNKFDDITSTNLRPNSNGLNSLTPKEKAKKIWKWVVMGIYLFFAGLGITGLIQSCVLKTSSTVGAGVELYMSKDDVAPYVSTYFIREKTKRVIEYDENGNVKLDENGNVKYIEVKYYELEQDLKQNHLTDHKTIKDIKEQLKNDYNSTISDYYGYYDNYSSTLKIVGLDGYALENSYDSKLNGQSDYNGLLQADNGYLFTNNIIIDHLNKEGQEYKAKNVWKDINFFALKRPDNIDTLSNSEKDYYGSGVVNITNALVAYEQINNKWIKVERKNGKFVTQDVNADGVIDTSEFVEIKDQNRISKFKYSLENLEVVTLEKDSLPDGVKLLNSEAFARDYLQSLLNVSIRFPQMKDFYKKITGNEFTDSDSSLTIFDNFSKDKFENFTNIKTRTNTGLDSRAFDENKLFTSKEAEALLTYQNEITNIMKKVGFSIRKQVYSDSKSEFYEKDATKKFEVEFLPEKRDKKSIIVGTGSAGQKPITSWSESWGLGPFYGLIVYPLSYIINGIMGPIPSSGGWVGIFAIIVAILLTRVIVTLFTYKSLFSSHKQQQLNPKKAKIDAKYEPFKGNREMEQRKRQEISKLYKSHNISMVEPLKAMCISMPIFFAVWRIVQGIPDIKATTWLGIQFSQTSWRELFSGEWQYLPLLLIAAGVQALSQLLPRILNNKRMKERANKAEIAALKKANKTQNIMMIVFVVMSVIFEAGVQIYWIIGGLWQIAQTLIVHHIVKSNWYRTKGHKYL